MRNQVSQTGIQVRHQKSCATKRVRDARCDCKSSYEAAVWSNRDQKQIRRSFRTRAEAKAWRADATVAVRNRTLRAASPTTVREAGDALIAGMRDGTIRTRSGVVFKPSVVRGYERALRTRLYEPFGAVKLSDLDRRDVQDLAARMMAEGRDPSTVRNALMPLRVIYREALDRGEVSVSPVVGLRLPASRGRRDRVAAPAEAAKLIAALPESDRALWGALVYAGLRRGEAMALRWEDVDLSANVVRVERSYDPQAGLMVTPKSAKGVRTVPLVAVLRELLIAHRLRSGRATGLVFGRTTDAPFSYMGVLKRGRRVWAKASLAPINMHECRHSYASFGIAAGLNVKALSTYMGHSSIQITYDRYGHLLPGNETEAAGLMDAYLTAAVV